MRIHPEPTRRQAVPPKTGVVLVNLGTPDAPTPAAVRRYLKEFLSDPRVVEIPRLVWWCVLHAAILPFRSARSAEKYALVWTEQGSPLKVHTEKQALLLRGYLGARGHQLNVAYAMRYGNPALTEVLTRMKQEGCERILVASAYPQYSATTTASIFDAVFAHYAKERNLPELRFVKHYHDHQAYLQALEKSVLAFWENHGRPEKLVMSFHGLPKKNLTLGDPYFCECQKTARLLAAGLKLTPEQYLVTFQSRLGWVEWLQPYTAPTLKQMARDGVGRVDVICPGFTADCLETLEEIAIGAKHEFLKAGGVEFRYIPCLNEAPDWITALTEIVLQHLQGWPTASINAD